MVLDFWLRLMSVLGFNDLISAEVYRSALCLRLSRIRYVTVSLGICWPSPDHQHSGNEAGNADRLPSGLQRRPELSAASPGRLSTAALNTRRSSLADLGGQWGGAADDGGRRAGRQREEGGTAQWCCSAFRIRTAFLVVHLTSKLTCLHGMSCFSKSTLADFEPK